MLGLGLSSRSFVNAIVLTGMVTDELEQYEWTGTQNWTPLFSVLSAIEFRKSIGGEQRIMDYCQSLAIECVSIASSADLH